MVSHRFGVGDAPEAMETALDAERLGEGAHHRGMTPSAVRPPQARTRARHGPRAAGSGSRSPAGGSRQAHARVVLNEPAAQRRSPRRWTRCAQPRRWARRRPSTSRTARRWRPASRRIEAEIAPLDVLVNNAGVQHREPLHEIPEAAFRGGDRDEPHGRCSSSARRSGAGWSGAAAARSSTSPPRCPSSREPLPWAPTPRAKGGVKMLTQAMCADWAPARRAGERDRAGVLQHRAQPRAGRRTRVRRVAAAPHAGRALGRGRTSSLGAAGVSSPRTRRASSTGSSCSSTAACRPCV